MAEKRIAKLFKTGRSQAVRLPKEYRFEGDEVFIRRDPETGDVILSRKPKTWDGFLALFEDGVVYEDFLRPEDRDLRPHDRDPFEGWEE